MVRSILIAANILFFSLVTPCFAQPSSPIDKFVELMSERLTSVWNNEVKVAIIQYGGTKEAECVSNLSVTITRDEQETPNLNGKSDTIKIPLLYLTSQLYAIQAPAYFILGIPEAEDLESLFRAQENFFRQFREQVRSGGTPKLQSAFGLLGMRNDRYQKIEDELSISSDATQFANLYTGLSLEYVLLHEAGHALDRCNAISLYTKAQNKELRADDFATYIMNHEPQPTVLVIELLRLVTSLEGGSSDTDLGELSICRIARTMSKYNVGDPSYFYTSGISKISSDNFASRVATLSDFIQKRYSISRCTGYP